MMLRVVAHGADPGWNARIEETARLARTGGPVEVSYLMGPAAATNRFQDAARKLVEWGAREIVVVPLFVSSYSGHYEQIRYLARQTDSLDAQMRRHLGMAGIEPAAVNVPIRVARAIDDAPEAASVLAERARALAADRAGRALFLLGHGPVSAEDNAMWMKNLRANADRVRAETGFGDVKVGLLREDAPAEVRAEAIRSVREMIEMLAARTGKPVVVVPVLVSTGATNQVSVPKALEGLPIVYRGDPLLPHPSMARWIEARVREAAPQPSRAAP